MYIDTHCHISKDDYEDINMVIKNANDENVKYLILCGCDKKSIKESIEIANKYQNIYLAIGYHPSEVLNTTSNDLEELKITARENKKVVAIGEIGLDYHWDKENKEKQQQLFREQIKIAKELSLPIVVHSRDAFQDTYNVLKEEKHKGDIHCFSGNLENAKQYLSLGYYLGIGGVITFKNTNLKETIKSIPLEKIILETDSPYLAPVPHRGEKNESKYIPLIAEEIAKSKELPISEIEKITTNNAKDLFNLGFNDKID